jgi:hypothetical protein
VGGGRGGRVNAPCKSYRIKKILRTSIRLPVAANIMLCEIQITYSVKLHTIAPDNKLHY